MLKPLGSRVILVAVEDTQETESGLVLTGSAKEKPNTAKVVAIGEGKKLDDGSREEIPVAVDDVVLYEKYAGTEVKHSGEDYIIVNASDIVAIVE